MHTHLIVNDVSVNGFKERITARVIDPMTQAASRTVDIDRCGCIRIYDQSLPAGSLVVECEDCRNATPTPRERRCRRCGILIPADYPTDVTCGNCDGEIIFKPAPCDCRHNGCVHQWHGATHACARCGEDIDLTRQAAHVTHGRMYHPSCITREMGVSRAAIIKRSPCPCCDGGRRDFGVICATCGGGGLVVKTADGAQLPAGK